MYGSSIVLPVVYFDHIIEWNEIGYISTHLLFWIKCLNCFGLLFYEHWMYTTIANKKSASYERNHDYTKQFDWTYDLNCNLYNCYTKAKENPAIRYMKYMK